MAERLDATGRNEGPTVLGIGLPRLAPRRDDGFNTSPKPGDPYVTGYDAQGTNAGPLPGAKFPGLGASGAPGVSSPTATRATTGAGGLSGLGWLAVALAAFFFLKGRF